MLEYMAYDPATYEDETTISFNRVGVVVIIILYFTSSLQRCISRFISPKIYSILFKLSYIWIVLQTTSLRCEVIQ